jgi:hypothetical protein
MATGISLSTTSRVFPSMADKEMDPIRKFLDESERVMDKLKEEETRVLVELKNNAKELCEKEYKMPEQRTMPYLSVKYSYVQCYKDHP